MTIGDVILQRVLVPLGFADVSATALLNADEVVSLESRTFLVLQHDPAPRRICEILAHLGPDCHIGGMPRRCIRVPRPYRITSGALRDSTK